MNKIIITPDMLRNTPALEIMKLAIDYSPESCDHIIQFYENNKSYSLPVLNGVLLISIYYMEGYTPNYRYLNKVLDSWEENKTTTAAKAANLITRKARIVNNKANKNIRPEWTNEYVDELKELHKRR